MQKKKKPLSYAACKAAFGGETFTDDVSAAPKLLENAGHHHLV
jgi:hypothetical protein